MTFGYPQSQWDAAKTEALTILRARARRARTLAYSELAASIHSIAFNAEDHSFHGLLGELASSEHAEGRGMISVLVVHKPPGDMRPGPGFFKLARELGLDAYDRERF